MFEIIGRGGKGVGRRIPHVPLAVAVAVHGVFEECRGHELRVPKGPRPGTGHGDRIGIGVPPGIVDKAGNRAEPRHGLLMHARDIGGEAHVAHPEEEAVFAGSKIADERSSARLVDVDERDTRLLLEAFLDNGSADPLAAAGHQNMPVCQPPQHRLPPRVLFPIFVA